MVVVITDWRCCCVGFGVAHQLHARARRRGSNAKKQPSSIHTEASRQPKRADGRAPVASSSWPASMSSTSGGARQLKQPPRAAAAASCSDSSMVADAAEGPRLEEGAAAPCLPASRARSLGRAGRDDADDAACLTLPRRVQALLARSAAHAPRRCCGCVRAIARLLRAVSWRVRACVQRADDKRASCCSCVSLCNCLALVSSKARPMCSTAAGLRRWGTRRECSVSLLIW